MSQDQAAGRRALMGSKIEEFPNVHSMMKFHTERNWIKARKDDLDEVIYPWVDTASLVEIKHLIERMIEREATLTGCATELEDAACALEKKIVQDDEPPICNQCNGSGEGRGDGAVCTACKVKGDHETAI